MSLTHLYQAQYLYGFKRISCQRQLLCCVALCAICARACAKRGRCALRARPVRAPLAARVRSERSPFALRSRPMRARIVAHSRSERASLAAHSGSARALITVPSRSVFAPKANYTTRTPGTNAGADGPKQGRRSVTDGERRDQVRAAFRKLFCPTARLMREIAPRSSAQAPLSLSHGARPLGAPVRTG